MVGWIVIAVVTLLAAQRQDFLLSSTLVVVVVLQCVLALGLSSLMPVVVVVALQHVCWRWGRLHCLHQRRQWWWWSHHSVHVCGHGTVSWLPGRWFQLSAFVLENEVDGYLLLCCCVVPLSVVVSCICLFGRAVMPINVGIVAGAGECVEDM